MRVKLFACRTDSHVGQSSSQCQEAGNWQKRQDDAGEEDDAQGSSALNASGNIRFIKAKPSKCTERNFEKGGEAVREKEIYVYIYLKTLLKLDQIH